MKNILIVEDESLVALDLAESIRSFGYNVVGIASNSKDAIEFTCNNKIDLVLMDICLKGEIDGIETAKAIKIYDKDIKLIYSTALSGEEDIQRAVETNPVAYLIKPILMQSLKASIEIAFFTPKKDVLIGDIILDKEFSFDSVSAQLIHNGVFVHLTKRERELLDLLIRSSNQVVTIYDIENEIWPEKSPNISTLRALVSRLRAKLKYKIIETIPSMGYRITLK